MNAWLILQLASLGLAILLGWIGQRFSLPLAMWSGLAMFGMTCFLVGLEAALKRQIVLGPRRYSQQTYTGIAAYAQAVQFMMLAAFLIGIAIAGSTALGDTLFDYFVRHPGPLLLAFGVYCLMQAVISIVGFSEQQQGARWIVWMNFFAARLLPGLILIVIGLAASGSGLLEMAAPTVFDQLGGKILEIFFGIR